MCLKIAHFFRYVHKILHIHIHTVTEIKVDYSFIYIIVVPPMNPTFNMINVRLFRYVRLAQQLWTEFSSRMLSILKLQNLFIYIWFIHKTAIEIGDVISSMVSIKIRMCTWDSYSLSWSSRFYFVTNFAVILADQHIWNYIDSVCYSLM